jgi:hypothetical protein
LRSLSYFVALRSYAACGRIVCCGVRVSERFVRVPRCRCRVREESTDVAVAGTKLVLRFANADVMIGCIVLFQAAISDVLPCRRSSSDIEYSPVNG